MKVGVLISLQEVQKKHKIAIKKVENSINFYLSYEQ